MIKGFAMPTETASPIGQKTPRIDGPLKVTGAAKYSSDFNLPGMLYAVPVCATIANGRLTSLDTRTAAKMPGVRAIFHRANIGDIYRATVGPGFAGIMDERRPPFEDDIIRYCGQYIALAVADTFEAAKAAADAVRATYTAEKPNVDNNLEPDDEPEKVQTTFSEEPRLESHRGNADAAFASAPVQLDQTYVTPTETHNPIELHATVANWDGHTLTLYETIQGIFNMRGILAQMFGLPEERVRVITKFLGSGFGGKLWPWTHCPLAAAASRKLNKPVKLVVSRKMMFQTVGHRARTQQRVRLGATPDGKLVSLMHDYVYHTALLDHHHEDCGEATGFHYSVPNLRVSWGRAKRNIGSATDMRGPGAVPGLYATESAMNELADQLKIDPVQLRILNEPKLDESLQLPFSSRHYLECLDVGSKKFGWSNRTPEVGSMKRDGLVLGWGMAGAAWIAARFAAEANFELRNDGTVRVACGTQDIGTGTYTILAQLAADKAGVPLDKVQVDLGDTSLPEGPISGGSMVTGSVVPAVFQAADNAIQSLLKIATTTPGSPFEKQKPDNLQFKDGRILAKDDPSKSLSFSEMLRRANVRLVSGNGKAEGSFGNPKPKFSTHSFGAHFVEVTWQPETARLRINRTVTVIDAGRILNPLAGRNQIEGAVVMGIGMALFEQTHYEPTTGAPLNSNLADYIITTNADAPSSIDVHFLDYPDFEINPLGARGVGEIGLAGIAAAITSAVHHATGVRVRELPVEIEDLLA